MCIYWIHKTDDKREEDKAEFTVAHSLSNSNPSSTREVLMDVFLLWNGNKCGIRFCSIQLINLNHICFPKIMNFLCKSVVQTKKKNELCSNEFHIKMILALSTS